MSSEINLKRKLIETTDAVRKKYKTLKFQSTENRLGIEEFHGPVTTQLKSLSNVVENVSKHIPKSVGADEVTSREPHHLSLIETNKEDKVDEGGEEEDNNTFFEAESTSPQSPPLSPEPEITSTPSQDPLTNIDLLSVEPNVDLDQSSLLTFEKKPYALANEYVRKIKVNVRGFDTTYGIYPSSDDKMRMGKCIVRFPYGKISIWKGNKLVGQYPISTELIDLIFLQKPNALKNLDTISKEVLNTYYEILIITSSIYHNHNPLKGLKISKSEKYQKIIKPLIEKEGSGIEDEEKEEKGVHSRLVIPKIKTLNDNTNINYVYWNKPKELVERLKLLWASKRAGNTGMDNEIISIIEELREEKIIY